MGNPEEGGPQVWIQPYILPQKFRGYSWLWLSLYQPEGVGAWVGYPTSRFLSPMGNPEEGGPLVCVQPYIMQVFCKLKCFSFVKFSAKFDDIVC